MSTPAAAKGGIADVQVRGMNVMDPDTVLMRLTIRKGDTPDANAINEEVKRIWDMGYFSDVQAAAEGNVLVFTVVEKPRIDNIQVEGSKDIDKDDVLAAMGTKPGSVLNEQVLSDDLQKVTESTARRLLPRQGQLPAGGPPRRPGGAYPHRGRRPQALHQRSENRRSGKAGLRRSGQIHGLKPRGIFPGLRAPAYSKKSTWNAIPTPLQLMALTKVISISRWRAPQWNTRTTASTSPSRCMKDRATQSGMCFAGDVIDSEDKMLQVVKMDDWKKSNKYFSLTVMQEDSKRLTDYYADYGYAFAEVDTRLIKAGMTAAIKWTWGMWSTKNRKSSSVASWWKATPKPATTSSCVKCAWAIGDMYEVAPNCAASNERLKLPALLCRGYGPSPPKKKMRWTSRCALKKATPGPSWRYRLFQLL